MYYMIWVSMSEPCRTIVYETLSISFNITIKPNDAKALLINNFWSGKHASQQKYDFRLYFNNHIRLESEIKCNKLSNRPDLNNTSIMTRFSCSEKLGNNNLTKQAFIHVDQ